MAENKAEGQEVEGPDPMIDGHTREEWRELGKAEVGMWTITNPDGTTGNLDDIEALGEAYDVHMAKLSALKQESAEKEKRAGEIMAQEIARENNIRRAAAEKEAAEAAALNRAESHGDHDEPGYTPWTDEDIEQMSEVSPADVSAALASTTDKMRSLNMAEPIREDQ